jgi:hypothetical protein
MERRKFLIGAGSLAAGAAAATGTGAFTSVEAERDLTVEVASDSQAYLAFGTTEQEIGNISNNYEYAEISDEELVIDFDTNSAGGEGVNPNAVTRFDDVFEIRNQGTEPVEEWVELGGGLEDYLDVYAIYGGNTFSIVGEDNAFSGNGATHVGDKLRIGIEVDTTNVAVNNDTLEGTITVHAESTL